MQHSHRTANCFSRTLASQPNGGVSYSSRSSPARSRMEWSHGHSKTRKPRSISGWPSCDSTGDCSNCPTQPNFKIVKYWRQPNFQHLKWCWGFHAFAILGSCTNVNRSLLGQSYVLIMTGWRSLRRIWPGCGHWSLTHASYAIPPNILKTGNMCSATTGVIGKHSYSEERPWVKWK